MTAPAPPGGARTTVEFPAGEQYRSVPRLVLGGVERLAGRIVGLHPRPLQGRTELAVDQRHATGQRLLGGDLLALRVLPLVGGDAGVGFHSGRPQGTLQVVESGQQLAGDRGLAAPLGLLGLAGGALAVVLEVGPGALGELQVLVALPSHIGK